MNSNEIVQSKLLGYLKIITSPILKIFGNEWERTVRRNFTAGGRPKWTPRKKVSKKQRGRNILVISGALKNYQAVVNVSESRVALIPDSRARAYAKIHNEGGVINVPQRQKKFRNKKGKSVFASKKHKNTFEKTIKAHTIVIPKREHTNIPREDIDKWARAVKSYLKL